MTNKHAKLSAWHLTMMALGTVVGGSFFLGSATAIKAAGPGILISFLLGGTLVYIILAALSEMTVSRQAPGSFRAFAQQMYGPGVGFVIGWVYWAGLTLAMSSEATAASAFLKAWIPGLSLPLMAAIIIITITVVNLVGARTLSTLESGLAIVKLSAIAVFIVIAFALIMGLLPGRAPIGLGFLTKEPLLPGGLAGIAGSMLIVMFSYAGFEVIGLAASEASDPHRTIPRAILYTVLGLVGLYTVAITVLLPLIPTARLSENVSPLVAGLSAAGISRAAVFMNAVLVTAILSTMLAAMFGMGRMIRSLADEGHAPSWLRDEKEIPTQGILFSGASMLIGVGLANILPTEVYLFLVSSGGFSLLLTYVIIMATHYKFRRAFVCPPKGHCQLRGYPYTTLLGMFTLILIIAGMPLIPGQGSGLIAGLALTAFFALSFLVFQAYTLARNRRPITFRSILGLTEINTDKVRPTWTPLGLPGLINPLTDMEAGDELTIEQTKKTQKDRGCR